MTAADLGIAIAVGYTMLIMVRGFAISFLRHIRESDPDLHALLISPTPDKHHPLSVWVAGKLDARREKSRKPRA